MNSCIIHLKTRSSLKIKYYINVNTFQFRAIFAQIFIRLNQPHQVIRQISQKLRKVKKDKDSNEREDEFTNKEARRGQPLAQYFEVSPLLKTSKRAMKRRSFSVGTDLDNSVEGKSARCNFLLN